MSAMGGSCSLQRRTVSSRDHFFQVSNEDKDGHPLQNIRRHSVDVEVPNESISTLYPIEENYIVNEKGDSRSPKSLVQLCVDTVCRHLTQFEGDLPEGIPQNIVDHLMRSLIQHSALNATTLKRLRNCEIGELSLASCRCVTDKWLFALNSNNNGEMCAPNNLVSLYSDPNRFEEIKDNIQSSSRDIIQTTTRNRTNASFEDVSSSCSTSSFHSAVSSQNQTSITVPISYNESVPLDEVMTEPQIKQQTSLTSQTISLDLCGSQRLTDKGLLHLRDLRSLQVAKLDNCHSLVGSGFLVFSHSHQLHTLSLSNCRCLTDEAIENICHLYAITTLSLDGCRCLTDITLQAISHLFQLSKLDLSQCDLITDKGLEYLHSLSHIEDLSLGWCRSITDKGIGTLSSQPQRAANLRSLCLARCQISDDGIRYLGKFKALEYLDLNGCTTIGTIPLTATMRGLPSLSYLDVSYCHGIVRAGLQGKIDNLQSLDLGYSGTRDSHLASWTDLSTLTELNLDSCPVSDWSLAHLADNDVVPNLSSLDLADTDVTDVGLVHLSKFRKLSHLSLFYCNITNSGLCHLSAVEKLEVLNLDSRDIGDEGISFLCTLKFLRSLDLFSCRITDIGCAHLAKIYTLESLELCGGGVSNNGCKYLSSLVNLTSLNLSQNERITNLGASFFTALQNLKSLNLSNTRVDASILPLMGKLTQLQSLALYDCDNFNIANQGNPAETAMPTLKCLRVQTLSEDYGKVHSGGRTPKYHVGEGSSDSSNDIDDDDIIEYEELNSDSDENIFDDDSQNMDT